MSLSLGGPAVCLEADACVLNHPLQLPLIKHCTCTSQLPPFSRFSIEETELGDVLT